MKKTWRGVSKPGLLSSRRPTCPKVGGETPRSTPGQLLGLNTCDACQKKKVQGLWGGGHVTGQHSSAGRCTSTADERVCMDARQCLHIMAARYQWMTHRILLPWSLKTTLARGAEATAAAAAAAAA